MFSKISCIFAVELKDKVMKKVILFMLCSSLLMSSCDTYTGSGAYAGSSIGSILGGLSGGPRGSDIGTIVGMAGGAMVGAAIGSQADKAQAEREAAYQRDRKERSCSNRSASRHHTRSKRSSSVKSDDMYDYSAPVTDNSEIFDSTNSGDDRLYDFKVKDYTGDK